MTAPDPKSNEQGPEEVKRGLRKLVIGLVVLIVIVAIAVALSNLGGDDDPSGGGNEGLAPSTVTLEQAVGS